MIEQFGRLIGLLATLKDAGALTGYALAGGLAVSVWSPPRALLLRNAMAYQAPVWRLWISASRDCIAGALPSRSLVTR